MKIKQRVAAALVGIVGAVAIATPAHALSYLHRIINYNTGLCLEVPNSSMQMNEQLTVSVCGPTSGSSKRKRLTSVAPLCYCALRRASAASTS